MGRSRRGKSSNRRLPNSSRSPQRAYTAVGTLTRLFGPPTVFEWVDPVRKPKRQLAKNKNLKVQSRFPKTFGVSTLTPKQVKEAVRDAHKPISICTARSQRNEIIHATGNAGKRGQKSPIWKKSSKVRC